MILAGGENLIDFMQIETTGEDLVYRVNPGGSPYNCAKAIGRRFVPGSFLTPISTGALGGFDGKWTDRYGRNAIWQSATETGDISK